MSDKPIASGPLDPQTVAGFVSLALLGAGAYLLGEALRPGIGPGCGLLAVGLALYAVVSRSPPAAPPAEG